MPAEEYASSICSAVMTSIWLGIDVEPQFRSRNLLAGIVNMLQLREVPVRLPQTGIRLFAVMARAFSCLRRR